MNERTDQQLPRDFPERKSEEAFAAIVHRYVDLVTGEKLSLGPMVDFVPTISADGQSVELGVIAKLNRLSTTEEAITAQP